jgi:hypothetical protein
MNASNLITENNVEQFKCKVLTLVCPAYGTANLLIEIETAMSMFQYENESVETIVFDYCFYWHQDKYSI